MKIAVIIPTWLLLACHSSSSNGESVTELTPSQYHIQTDQGKNRFFRYETLGGQFRKETRLEDGSVVGSYGWVDANDLLRVYDYVADLKGYRVVQSRTFKVDRSKKGTTVKPDNEEEALSLSVIPTAAGPLEVPFSSVQPLGGKLKSQQSSKESAFENAIDEGWNVVPGSERLQRRLFDQDNGAGVTVIKVEPLFGLDEEIVADGPEEKTIPLIQPRGEGHRLLYSPQEESRSPKSVSGDRGKYFVVKRRRQPDAILRRGPQGKVDLDYQTDHAFHRERVSEDGQRIGEYGYIDPLGVRRVVTYTTGPEGELAKEKENDFVGVDTYFESH